MTKRQKMGLIMIMAIVAVVGVAAWWMNRRNPEIDELIAEYGFTVLVPPSNLLPPGTLVYRDRGDPRRFGILCPSNASLGTEFRPHTSEVPELEQTLSQEFGLSSNLRQYFRSTFPMVSNVTLTLSQPMIYEVSIDQVYEYSDKRSSACAEVIRRFEKSGTPISMITAVLQADVNYVIEFDTDFDVRAENKILVEIADSLDAQYDSRRKTTIRGKALFWGVRDLSEVVILDENVGGAQTVVSIAELPTTFAAIRDSISIVATDTAWGQNATIVLREGTDIPIRIQAGEGLIPRNEPLRTYPILGRE